MSVIQYISIGLAAGVVSGLFGVGGGLVIVPCLTVFLGMALHSAIGTSLGALLLPVGLLGVLEFHRNGNLDIKAALLIAVGIFIGTYFGAKIVQPLSPVILRRIYAVFLVGISIKLWFK